MSLQASLLTTVADYGFLVDTRIVPSDAHDWLRAGVEELYLPPGGERGYLGEKPEVKNREVARLFNSPIHIVVDSKGHNIHEAL